MKIGVLTSGGDCPGLNAVIRAIVRKGVLEKFTIIGIKNGWKGIIDEDYLTLGIDEVGGIIGRGGTILGTSRFSPFEQENGKELLLKRVKAAEFDALICIGGEGSMHIAKLAQDAGINVVGVPKTIDNDIYGTDYTFGFDTASNIAMEAIDRLHTTAESHHRIMVCEVMGRNAGWIAIRSGMAGGADMILIPEKKIKIQEVIDVINSRTNRGKLFSIIVVAEGCEFLEEELESFKHNPKEDVKLDDFGRERLGGISHYLAQEIEERTGIETRTTILGHVQRGGTPTAFDRVIGTRYGVHSVEMVKEGEFGKMAALKGVKLTEVALEKVISKVKLVDDAYYEVAKVFFR
jgi:ATP-dependent phosphofructokinase / diphosphate-dependent phosphofructokinase